MTRLRFEAQTGVTIYATLENSEIPFREGEEVSIRLKVVSISLLPNEKIPNIVWRGQLNPIGEFDIESDCMLVEIKKSKSLPSKSLVKWPSDTKNVFNVFTTSEDEDATIFDTDPVVMTKVVVQDIRENPFASMASTWFATLMPVGQKIGSSVIGNVEIIG